MRDYKADEKRWAQLEEVATEALEKARGARAQVTSKFAACAAGTGPEPTLAELENAEKLERAADHARMDARAHIRAVFGG